MHLRLATIKTSPISQQLHQIHLLENNLKDLRLQVDVEQRSMSRRLDTAITDRCYELLYKVQDLSWKLKTEKRNPVYFDATVPKNLKKKVQKHNKVTKIINNNKVKEKIRNAKNQPQHMVKQWRNANRAV